MTLGFKQIINKKLTYFPHKILCGLYKKNLIKFHDFCFLLDKIDFPLKFQDGKFHTMREDKKNKWKAGNLIHFVINNRTPKRYQFAPVLKCVSTQNVIIKWEGTFITITIDDNLFSKFNTAASWSHGLDNGDSKICELSKNDGFDDLESFLKYFSTNFTGKIIHWTNFKY